MPLVVLGEKIFFSGWTNKKGRGGVKAGPLLENEFSFEARNKSEKRDDHYARGGGLRPYYFFCCNYENST